MINTPNPITSVHGANGFYGIHQSQTPSLLQDSSSNLQLSRGLAGFGAGMSLTAGVLGGINAFNSANALNSQIDDLKKAEQLKLTQLDTALNQAKLVSAKQAQQTVSQQASDITQSGMDMSSSVFLTAINQTVINQMNKDFISNANVTVEKLNTLFDTRNKMEDVFQAQQGMVAQGFGGILSAGIGAVSLASILA